MTRGEIVFAARIFVGAAFVGPQQGSSRENLEGGRGDRLPPMWTVDTIFVENLVLQVKMQYFVPGAQAPLGANDANLKELDFEKMTLEYF